ncbi:MAG: Gfo/Idh/MocA family oxidoreductase, partial [Pseudomonadota bacterium]
MKQALVIGYGSIGKLHCDVLRSLGFSVSIVSQHALSGDAVFRKLDEALRQAPDYVVIASKTSLHRDQLDELMRSGFEGKIMVEKPLFA